jgi:hypothetical protein
VSRHGARVVVGARGRYTLEDEEPRVDGPARELLATGPGGEVRLRSAVADEAWLLEETALLRALQPEACLPEVLDFGLEGGRVYVVLPEWPHTLAGWLAGPHDLQDRARAAGLAVQAVAAVLRSVEEAPLALTPAAFALRGRGATLELRQAASGPMQSLMTRRYPRHSPMP